MNGKGRRSCTNKAYYEGNWKDGRMDGNGSYVWVPKVLYTYVNEVSYKGDWMDGKKHGKGISLWADRS